VTSGLAHPRAGRVRTGVGWDSRWWSPASRSSVSAPLIAGNEDGIKHCAMNVLHSLQHIGCAIPPQADAGWIGEAGPGPSYLDPGSGGPESDFTDRNTTFMAWNLMHLARMLNQAGGVPAPGNQRREWDAGSRFDFENPRVPLTPAVHAGWVSGPSADG
jgi:multimeric flavodoxin WrbA